MTAWAIENMNSLNSQPAHKAMAIAIALFAGDKTFDLQFQNSDYLIIGLAISGTAIAAGDSIKVQSLDANKVVVDELVTQHFLLPVSNTRETIDFVIPYYLPQDYYMRLTYTSISALSTILCKTNWKSYKLLGG